MTVYPRTHTVCCCCCWGWIMTHRRVVCGVNSCKQSFPATSGVNLNFTQRKRSYLWNLWLLVQQPRQIFSEPNEKLGQDRAEFTPCAYFINPLISDKVPPWIILRALVLIWGFILFYLKFDSWSMKTRDVFIFLLKARHPLFYWRWRKANLRVFWVVDIDSWGEKKNSINKALTFSPNTPYKHCIWIIGLQWWGAVFALVVMMSLEFGHNYRKVFMV